MSILRPWIPRWLRSGSPSQDPLIADLQANHSPAEVFRNAPFTLTLHLHNQGSEPWHRRGKHRVILEYRWLDQHAKQVIAHGDRLALPRTSQPDQPQNATLKLIAPLWLGDHVLEIELLRLNSLNGQNQGTRIQIPCRVNDSPNQDCDYVKWYQQVDLNRDYWTVVGPTTREHFIQLQQGQFEMILATGFAPNQSILDVGCGTGKLVEPLMNYLTEDGSYVGTDVGREGIAYCQERYQRKNFQFLVNEMTSIPIHDRSFDLIVLFSVFTHTYAAETEALLRELKRVLRPDGVILADVFESPLVRREAGRRGAVELGVNVIEELCQRVGLRLETAEKWSHLMGPFRYRRFFFARDVSGPLSPRGRGVRGEGDRR